MGRFGMKNIVKVRPFDYSLALMGDAGVGKTTTSIEVARKELGDDGYILLNIGRERGVDAINGAMYEDVKDWSTFEEIVDDIYENKEDYPNLKTVIFDTFDQLEEIAKKEVIRLHNIKNPSKQTNNFNSAFGGFNKPYDLLTDLIFDNIEKLYEVGIKPFYIFHSKKKTKMDDITNEQYDVITALMSDKMFNKVKQTVYVLGVCYTKRNIKEEVIGKDILGNDKTVSKATSQDRYISFRNKNFTLESKSRFSNIVDEVELSSDNFLTAVKDAIKKEFESNNQNISVAKAEKLQEKKIKENLKKLKEEKELKEKLGNIENAIEEIKEAFTNDEDVKEKIIDKMKDIGCKNFTELKNLDIAEILKVKEVIK